MISLRMTQQLSWMEQAGRLLAVAQGQIPAAAAQIIDIDLSSLPELPQDHRDYQRRLETRIKVQAQNDANASKRWAIVMDAWTDLYIAIKACTETTAPVFSRQLRDA